MKKVLVTGGAGYIGTHTCVELVAAGYEVVVIDNFSNSHPSVMNAVNQIVKKNIHFYSVDLRDAVHTKTIVQEISPHVTIHFAGLKSVSDSVNNPIEYYKNNLVGTCNLLDALSFCGRQQFVFSSSATVYGVPQYLPIDERHPLSAINPYGQTKLMIEQVLRDFSQVNPSWSIAILRYFNPVGAHSSGLIGENPIGVPNNLMPYIADVAAGRLKCLSVWGDDYETPDGTGIRDYIHVLDLAVGHIAAVDFLNSNKGIHDFNLGTGKGYSVIEVIEAFEKTNGLSIPYEFRARRKGDVASCYASTTKAQQQLGWKAHKTIEQMCLDHWQYKKQNSSK